MDDGFRLPAAALRRAITADTRIVFVTNPHNPSGVVMPAVEILALARDPRAGPAVRRRGLRATSLSETVLDDRRLTELPNLVVGRTFSKAYGLAGLRAGALVAHEETLAPMRRIVPPYSLNAWVDGGAARGGCRSRLPRLVRGAGGRVAPRC